MEAILIGRGTTASDLFKNSIRSVVARFVTTPSMGQMRGGKKVKQQQQPRHGFSVEISSVVRTQDSWRVPPLVSCHGGGTRGSNTSPEHAETAGGG